MDKSDKERKGHNSVAYEETRRNTLQ